MDFMDLHMHQLSSFLVAADSKSFSAAAEKLYISHTALIQQMNALEADLGFALFDRSSRGISLTESGKLFCTELKKYVAKLNAMLQKCRAIGTTDNKIRLANTSDIHQFYFLLDFYNGFRRDNPGIELEFVPVEPESIIDMCRDGAIDISAYFGFEKPSDHRDLIFYPFTSSRMAVFLDSEHPFADKAFLSNDELKDLSVHISAVVVGETLLTRQLSTIKADFRVVINATMQDVYKVCKNGGLFIYPDWVKNHFPDLRAIPLSPSVESIYYMICRVEHTPAVDAFMSAYRNYVFKTMLRE